jgi:hypothetical protein
MMPVWYAATVFTGWSRSGFYFLPFTGVNKRQETAVTGKSSLLGLIWVGLGEGGGMARDTYEHLRCVAAHARYCLASMVTDPYPIL